MKKQPQFQDEQNSHQKDRHDEFDFRKEPDAGQDA
jgi:hypothetical protein